MSALNYFSKELQDLWKISFGRLILVLIISVTLIFIFWGYGLAEFWYTIPLAMISAAVTSVIFEAPQFWSFVKQTALEAIQDRKYLEMLNTNSLEKMSEKILQVNYGLSQESQGGNLYEFVKANMLKYLAMAYQDSFDLDLDLFKKDGYIEIRMHKKVRITALSEESIAGEMNILLHVKPIPEQNAEFHFPFDGFHLRVNGRDVGFPESSKKAIKDEQTIKFEYKHKYQVKKDSFETIEYTIIGKEQEDEMVAHLTFPLPAKGFKVTITANDFGDCDFSHYFSGSVEPKAEQVRKGTRKFVLDYDGWMIPGNSLTVFFKPEPN